MKKIIFMDIDGTLTAQDGLVPESAKKAIIRTRELGNEVILSTGRSLAEITDDILNIGFDGIIGAGGSYIEYNGQVIKHMKMTYDEAIRISTYLDDREIGYYMESNQGLFASKYCVSKIKEASQKLFEDQPELFINKDNPEPNWFIDILNESRDKKIPYDDINKISFISTEFPFEKVKKEFEKDFEIYHATVFEFGPQSGEIGLKNIDKKIAIHELFEHIEGDFKTFAYGDGLNDITMFETVDHAVAMENAYDELKAVSDEQTSIAEEDGIYLSFKKNALI